MKPKPAFQKASRAMAAASMAAVLMVTGVSAAEPGAYAGSSITAPVQSDNQYGAFLGYNGDYAMLEQPIMWTGNFVNLWSGNLVMKFILPVGNYYGNFSMDLVYNSQANCNIGLGNNVVMNYWAQFTRIDDSTVQVMTGTGGIDTFVKNPETGAYEGKNGTVEEQMDGGYYANVRGSEYYFDETGRLAQMHLYNSYVTVTYNEMGYIDTLSNQNGLTYQFAYEPSPVDQSLRCVSIDANYLLTLDYDDQGNLAAAYQVDNPSEPIPVLLFACKYGDDHLMTDLFELEEHISINYQLINGFHKVTNFNGTQIAYANNQTISIAPEGTITTWQFDDNGNWIP